MATMRKDTSLNCIVCETTLANSNSRRRLASESTRHVIPVLVSLGSGDQYVSAIENGVFIFRQCFRDTERIQKLRSELEHLVNKIKSSS